MTSDKNEQLETDLRGRWRSEVDFSQNGILGVKAGSEESRSDEEQEEFRSDEEEFRSDDVLLFLSYKKGSRRTENWSTEGRFGVCGRPRHISLEESFGPLSRPGREPWKIRELSIIKERKKQGIGGSILINEESETLVS